MGRYDNTNDTDGLNTVALWKPNDAFPAAALMEFEESGTDESPALTCEDSDGNKYLLYGAWPRNVKEVVKTYGSKVGNWEKCKLRVGKTGRQLELVPVKKVVKEEKVE